VATETTGRRPRKPRPSACVSVRLLRRRNASLPIRLPKTGSRGRISITDLPL